MPNKLFSYLAAGLPVVAYNAAECAEFIEKHGVGIVIEKIDDLRDRYDEHEGIREVVKEKRHEFTMETQVNKIKSLYEHVRRIES